MSVVAAALCGFVLDLLLADPRAFPHPVVWMGPGYWGAGAFTASAFSPNTPRTVCCGCGVGGGAADGHAGVERCGVSFDLAHSSSAGLCCAGAVELAGVGGPGLALESGRVYEQLRRGDLAAARRAVGRIVGRDTGGAGRGRSDPGRRGNGGGKLLRRRSRALVYLLLGGAPLALCYKAVNTMDSMVGYKK